MLMKEPFISIIIPCYNTATYLPKGFEILSSMEYLEETELIFIDDGSTDETLALLNEFAGKVPQAKVIAQPNLGVSAARNAGISLATGKYILLLDGDDYLASDAIRTIKHDIGESDLLLTPITEVYSNHQNIRPLPIPEGEYSVIDLYKSCDYFPTLPMLVYKSDIIKDNHLQFSTNIPAGEVYTFTCECLRYCKSISVRYHSFYLYNIRPSSATHSPNYDKDITILHSVERIYATSDPALLNLQSYTRTVFMSVVAFTYNKYAKFGLTDQQATNTIQTILNHPIVCSIIKKTAFNIRYWNRDKFLAGYMFITRVWGYKLLANICSLTK